MPDLSTKPYLIRAIYEWCNDSGFTPYIAVVAGEGVKVPAEHVKNGEIVLNVSALATNRLSIGNDAIEFQARFGGVAREVYIPISRVIAIYARESGQGMAFEPARSIPIGGGPDTVMSEAAPAPGSAPGPVPGSVPGPVPAPALAPAAGPPKPAALELASSKGAGALGDAVPPPRPPGAPAPGERPHLKRVK